MLRSPAMSSGRIIAAVSGSPRRWAIEIVRTGRDLNGKTRSAASLRRAAAHFEGRPIKVLDMVTADGRRMHDHQKIDALVGLETMNVVGHVENVRYEDRAFAGRGGLVGDAVLIEGDRVADALQSKLEGLRASGGLAKGAVAVSFNGYGEVGPGETEEILAVDSVDVVTHPAAYGCISHRVAASLRSAPMKDLIAYLTRLCAALMADIPATVATPFALAKHMVARLKASADLTASAATAFGLAQSDLTGQPLETLMGYIDVAQGKVDSERLTASNAAAAAEAARRAAAGGGSGGDDHDTDPDVLASRRRAKASADEIEAVATGIRLRAACVEKRLPSKMTERLLASYKGKSLTADEVVRVVAEKVAELDEMRSQEVAGRTLTVGTEPRDRLVASLARMLSSKCPQPEGMNADTTFLGSIHKFARDGFGIDLAESARGDSERRRIRASIDTTNFDAVFAEALGRSFLAEYKGDTSVTQAWRKIVNVVSERDFRTKQVISTTYYDELPVVAKGAAYQPLTSPTDRKESYAMEKRGGTEDILWEDMLNDDLGLVARILKGLALTARETLNERVFYNIRIATQPTMADTAKLTSAAGARLSINLLTAALSADATGWANFILAYQQMLSQTGGAGKPKGIKATHVVVPLGLERAASVLFAGLGSETNDIPARRGLNAMGGVVPEIVLDLGTSNQTDWFLLAPNAAEVLRVAFLGGREEPEIFIANNEVFGAMFTNDKIVIKARHPWVIGVVDYAGIQGNDVA